MEEGYYVPEIEEFHVGFEFEYFGNKSTGVTDWDKRIAFEGKGSFADNYMIQIFNALKENKIRVKYLCKEDIEALGFIHIGVGWYEKGTFRIHKWVAQELDIHELFSGEWERIFLGKSIKNKSELKKLIKQLNIE